MEEEQTNLQERLDDKEKDYQSLKKRKLKSQKKVEELGEKLNEQDRLSTKKINLLKKNIKTMEEKLQQKAPEDSTSSEKEEDESPKKKKTKMDDDSDSDKENIPNSRKRKRTEKVLSPIKRPRKTTITSRRRR